MVPEDYQQNSSGNKKQQRQRTVGHLEAKLFFY
jgi:hypothetical protein